MNAPFMPPPLVEDLERVKCGKRFPRDRSGVPSLAGLPGRGNGIVLA
jgi:hypothetical protein